MNKTALYIICIALCFGLAVHADDWPTFRHDNHRSSRASCELPTAMKLKWSWLSPAPPDPAWTKPAKWDAFSGNKGLQSLRNIDPVFYVTANTGHVYFGSSADDAVHCLNAGNGKEEWVYITGAPVRIAPTLHESKLLFGSDDGNIYCLNSEDGKLLWKFSPAPDARKILNNGNLISLYPCRTGVLVQDGLAYFASSLLPWQNSYLCSVNLDKGRADGPGTYVNTLEGLTLQGAVLSSTTTLYLPQGRSPALAYDIKTGKALGALGGSGGVDCLITADGKFISGPSNQRSGDNVIQLGDADNRKAVASFPGPERLIADDNSVFYHDGRYLICRNRIQYADLYAQRTALLKKKPRDNAAIDEIGKKIDATLIWKKKSDVPLEYAITGKYLVTGLENGIALYSVETGEPVWQEKVDGRAYGITIANGQLLVSTDKGGISCYAAE